VAIYTNPDVDQHPHFKQIFYADTQVAIFTCHGNPDGVILANTGSLALSDDGNVYKKTTDNIATGWTAITGGGGGGANQTLSNLTDGAVAINTTLASDTNNTDDLGTALLQWRDLFLSGFIRMNGTGVDLFHTPSGADVPTKINVVVFDPGAFGQIVAMGIGDVDSTSRVMSLFDKRSSAHQPTLSVFSPNESQVVGLSWDGQNTIGFVKSSSGDVGLQGRAFIAIPTTAPPDADIPNSFVTLWVDEGLNLLTFRVRYSSGVLKTGTITLT